MLLVTSCITKINLYLDKKNVHNFFGIVFDRNNENVANKFKMVIRMSSLS